MKLDISHLSVRHRIALAAPPRRLARIAGYLLPALILPAAVLAAPAAGPAAAAGPPVPAPHEAYVIGGVPGGIAVVDTRAHRVTRTIPLGAQLGISALMPDGRLYSLATDESVLVYDTVRRRLITRIDAGGGLVALAAAPRDHKVYGTDHHYERIVTIDTDSGTATSMRSGTHAMDVEVATGGHRAYVATYGYILVLDTRTDQVVRTVRTGLAPRAMALDMALGRAVLADVGSPFVSVVDLGTGAELARFDVGYEPEGVAVDRRLHRAFISGMAGRLAVLDIAAPRPVATLDVAPYGQSIAVVEPGRAVYVHSPGMIDVLDPRTLRTVARIPGLPGVGDILTR